LSTGHALGKRNDEPTMPAMARISPLATADRAGFAGPEGASTARRTILSGLEHTEKLADPADKQPFLVDLDPRSSGCGENDVITGLDGHAHADVVPPVQTGSDRQHDPVLWRRLVGARGHEQPGTADPIGVQFFDHNAVEQGTELIAHIWIVRKSRPSQAARS
jgi:hypothetical protein